MARSNLVPYAFIWEKGKAMDLSEIQTLKLSMHHQVLEYYEICSNEDPGLTLTYFMARSNLVPFAFVWEKVKTMDFSETIVVYDIKVGRCRQLKWVHEALWVPKVKVIHSIFLNFFSLITADFNISSALRWAIQDQWSSCSNLICLFCFSVCFVYYFILLL